MTIQVSDLPSDVTDAQLAELKARFSKFGNLQKFEVMNQIITVELDRGEDAAIQALDGMKWPPRPLPDPRGRMDKHGGVGPRSRNPIQVKKVPPK
ncbi:hypothetical protein NIES4073_37560 [Kalymmatonema gypsitolerans NIES-4073]|jgi:hypothetical protein|nr:hypothetical protein NIES4073_37560 [Scytonema sp. NIES-4073]